MVVKKREEIRARRSYLRDFARANRKELTEAERLLWEHLRNRQLGGFKFRREYPIGEYIADFVCVDARLIIELDGGIHAEQVQYDEARERVLIAQGYSVLRFENSTVTASLQKVLERILIALRPTAPSPRPSPPIGGEGAGQTSIAQRK
jgi:very-short-patch-repair endonuclease